ncbi:hypothetical protein EQG49_01985 [Periweissella cryptocerci]|uniref:Uncharacterized protein n=1 Tax=Periweissella cryptocerci TaxID=2506420 RepID=A0A4P6YRN0_9LACO|nr:hypothetical protein [Periweissella cryptocerci]QBO35319.1 hypothetical protein EQG49_01985 [Periweissella cryptocerci]
MPSVSASSVGLESTPKSMRGTWYHWHPKTAYSKGTVYKNVVFKKMWSTDEQGYSQINVWRTKYKGKIGFRIGGAASEIQEQNVLTKVKIKDKYHKVMVSYLTDQRGDYGEIHYNFRSKSLAKQYDKKHQLSYDDYDTGQNTPKVKKQMKKVIVKYFGEKWLLFMNEH